MTLKLIIITCFAQQDNSKHGTRRGLIKLLHTEPYPLKTAAGGKAQPHLL